MGVNILDEVVVHTVLDGEQPPSFEILAGEVVEEFPGMKTESLGFFTIKNVHTLGYVFSTTVILLAGIIDHNNEQRIVLCAIALEAFERNPNELAAKIIRENGRWWLANKIGGLPSG